MQFPRIFQNTSGLKESGHIVLNFWKFAYKDIRQQKSIGSTRLEYELNVCSQEVIHITPVFEISFFYYSKVEFHIFLFCVYHDAYSC